VAARWNVLLIPYIIVMRNEMYKSIFKKIKIKKLTREGLELYIVTDGIMVGIFKKKLKSEIWILQVSKTTAQNTLYYYSDWQTYTEEKVLTSRRISYFRSCH
jgi:hypothetical protein